VEYYSGICRRSEQLQLARDPEVVPAIPEISIQSLDLKKAVAYLGTDEDEASWQQFDEYHRAALERLEADRVDFAIVASNTAHHRFDAIVRGIKIPVISILQVTAELCARIGATEVLILGTALVMESAKIRETFDRYHIKAAGPEDESDRRATVSLIAELQFGSPAGAVERLTGIVKGSLSSGQISKLAVCLACTELSLAFQGMELLTTFEHDNILYINTSAAHIAAAFEFACSDVASYE
jgi:aspartate racemase